VLYAREADRVRRVLGHRVLRIEHAGSTSVPGLPYSERITRRLERREIGGCIRGVDHNLHVFSAGYEETGRMLAFRDRLRRNRADRYLYTRVKRELSTRSWKYAQQYADAKMEVVNEILARAVHS
jgi:GrpB-like predicted nucleotidyltransferase (UPF0157 family)